MRAAQVRGMTADQLNDELLKLKKEQFNLRFQAASGQVENTARVRQIRRDIARIQTSARATAEGAPKRETKVKAEPKAKAESKAKAEPKAKAEAKAKPKTAAKAKAKPKAKTKAKS